MRHLPAVCLFLALLGCSPEQLMVTGQKLRSSAPAVEAAGQVLAPALAKPAAGVTVGIGDALVGLAAIWALWRAAQARRKAKGAHKRLDAKGTA